jgi:hypothetical protein
MFFWFNENFSAKLIFVRCAKVGELCATTLESEKIAVLKCFGNENGKPVEFLAFQFRPNVIFNSFK